LPDRFDVAVFENKGPAFGPEALPIDLPNGERFGFATTAYGRCEVVVFSPEHEGSLGAMSVERIRTVIGAWMERTDQLQRLAGVVQVFPFENRGEEIGVTLHHPHGQIYAYPFVTPTTRKLLQSIDSYSEDFFQSLLDFERAGQRKIIDSDNFLAYVPFAARWPIEVHLLPKRNINDLAQLRDAETDELANVYKKLLGAVDGMYETPTAYISGWHQAPMIENRERVRLMLQITSPRRAIDKLKYLAGSESAMGAFVGDIAPEETAGRLRDLVRD
jgi:UDPglucose--hexose-1-phosphate uridylyltransferase